jgi:hypothetical protein
MRGKPINDHADGLVARPKHGRDKSKGKNAGCLNKTCKIKRIRKVS